MYDLSHTLPLVSILGTVLTVAGASCVLQDHFILNMAMHALDWMIISGLFERFTAIFAYSAVVDGLVIWITTVSSRACRELVYARSGRFFISFYKFIVGREALFFLLLLVAISVLLQIVYLGIMTPSLIMFEILMEGCQAGHKRLNGLAKGLSLSALLPEHEELDERLIGFCDNNAIIPRQVLRTGIGGLLCVLGQILILIAVSYGHGHLSSAVPKEPDEETALVERTENPKT